MLLQLHGGGYIMALTDMHRSLAVRQAVLMNAGDIYCVDYRTAPPTSIPRRSKMPCMHMRAFLRAG